MNTHQATRRIPRATLAVKGARNARRRTQLVRTVARQLDLIAPGTVRVRIVPVTANGQPRTWVELSDASGRTVSSAAEQCRAAYGLLGRAFPGVEWDRARDYDARTGVLAVDEPTAPADLGPASPPADESTLALAHVAVKP